MVLGHSRPTTPSPGPRSRGVTFSDEDGDSDLRTKSGTPGLSSKLSSAIANFESFVAETKVDKDTFETLSKDWETTNESIKNKLAEQKELIDQLGTALKEMSTLVPVLKEEIRGLSTKLSSIENYVMN